MFIIFREFKIEAFLLKSFLLQIIFMKNNLDWPDKLIPVLRIVKQLYSLKFSNCKYVQVPLSEGKLTKRIGTVNYSWFQVLCLATY